jgi:hypothetical protein
MFISSPLAGQIYYAQRSCKSVRLLWSVLKIADPFCNGRRIHAREVPAWVKARAYHMLEGDRLREKSDARLREKSDARLREKSDAL